MPEAARTIHENDVTRVMNVTGGSGHQSGMINRTLLMAVVVGSTVAFADPVTLTQSSKRSPFDRTFGLGGYATGWAGAYGGAGVGGRLRYEAFSFLGLDLFGEALIVPVPHGVRHDHPIGFNLYVPFRLGSVVRLRPLLGMCVTPSFFHPEEPGAPRADTILVGAHLGGGVELALHDRLSFFAEAKAVAWFGNDRSVQGWTGVVGGEVRPFLLGQAQLGFTFHLGGA